MALPPADGDGDGHADDEGDVPVGPGQSRTTAELDAAVESLMKDRHLRMLRFDSRPEVRIPAVISMCEQLMKHPLATVRQGAAEWFDYWTTLYPEFAVATA